MLEHTQSMARCCGKVKLTKDQSLELQKMLDEGISEYSICKRFKEMVERRNDMKQYIIQGRNHLLVGLKESLQERIEKEKSDRRLILKEITRKVESAFSLNQILIQVTLTGKEAEVFNSLNLGIEAVELK